ncbi:MAG: hypothetical protein JW839_05660 [Candidatus Lokiarchaeota archaeon]|nr:hypothetical protein [Candidatus Lokiarchaeota archaeon]
MFSSAMLLLCTLFLDVPQVGHRTRAGFGDGGGTSVSDLPTTGSEAILLANASRFNVTEHAAFRSLESDVAIKSTNLTLDIPSNWEGTSLSLSVSDVFQQGDIFFDYDLNGNFNDPPAPWTANSSYLWTSGTPSSTPYARIEYNDTNEAGQITANGGSAGIPADYYGYLQARNSSFGRSSAGIDLGAMIEPATSVLPIDDGFEANPGYTVLVDPFGGARQASTVSATWNSVLQSLETKVDTSSSFFFRGSPSVAFRAWFNVPFEADSVVVTLSWSVQNLGYEPDDEMRVRARVDGAYIDGTRDVFGTVYTDASSISLEVDNTTENSASHGFVQRSYDITDMLGTYGYRQGWHALDFGVLMGSPNAADDDVIVSWDSVTINASHEAWYEVADVSLDYLYTDLGGVPSDARNLSMVLLFGDAATRPMRYLVQYTSTLPTGTSWSERQALSIKIPHTYEAALKVDDFVFQIGLDYAGPIIGNTNDGQPFLKRLQVDSISMKVNYTLSSAGLQARINGAGPWLPVNQTNTIPLVASPPSVEIQFSSPLSGNPFLSFEAEIRVVKASPQSAIASVSVPNYSAAASTWNVTYDNAQSITEIESPSLSRVELVRYGITVSGLPAHDGLGAASQDWEPYAVSGPSCPDALAYFQRSSSSPFAQSFEITDGTCGRPPGSLAGGQWTVLARQSNYMTAGHLQYGSGEQAEKYYGGNDTEAILRVRNATGVQGNYLVHAINASSSPVSSFPRYISGVQNYTLPWTVPDQGVGQYTLYSLWNDTEGGENTTRLGWWKDTFEVWRRTTGSVDEAAAGVSVVSGTAVVFHARYNQTSPSNTGIQNASVDVFDNATGNLWGIDWPPGLYHVGPITYEGSGRYAVTTRTTVVPVGNYRVKIVMTKPYFDPITVPNVWLNVTLPPSVIAISFASGVENVSGAYFLSAGNVPFVNDTANSLLHVRLSDLSNGSAIRDALVTGRFALTSSVMVGVEEYAFTANASDKGLYRIALDTSGLAATAGSNYTLQITCARSGYAAVFVNISVQVNPRPLNVQFEALEPVFEDSSIELRASAFIEFDGALQPATGATLQYGIFNASGFLFGGVLPRTLFNLHSRTVDLTSAQDLAPGTYYTIINASCTDCAPYSSGALPFTVVAKAKTLVQVSFPETIRAGNSFAIGARLLFNNGTPVVSQDVLLTINYSAAYSYQVLAKTGATGLATYDLVIPELYVNESLVVRADYSGSADRGPCTAIGSQIIRGKIPVTITFTETPAFIRVGYSATFGFQLGILGEVDYTGYKLGIVAFYDASTTPFVVSETVTNQTGHASFTITEVADGFENISFYVEFAGTSQIEERLGGLVNMSVAPRFSSGITLTGVPAEIRIGQQIALEVTLSSSSPETLSGMPVQVVFDYGTLVFPATYFVGSTGKVAFTQQIQALAPGAFSIRVSFAGTTKVAPSGQNYTYTVLERLSTRIAMNFTGGRLNSGLLTFVATLSDGAGQPVKDVDVHFLFFASDGSLAYNFTVTTDNDGVGRFTREWADASSYRVQVTFSGKDTLASSLSTYVDIQIVTPLSTFIELLPYIVLGAGILLVLAIAIQRGIVIPRRKKRNAALRELYQRFSDAENIQYILVLTDTGLPLFSKPLSNVPIDENLVSGFLSAISSFGAEIGSKLATKGPEKGKGLEQLAYGQFKIVVNDYYNIRTALLLVSDASESLKAKLRDFNRRFYEKHEALLKNWRGQALAEQPIVTIIEQVFEVDLLYTHGVIQNRADEYVKPLSKSDTRLAIVGEARKAPFNGFFKIRAMIDALKTAGKDDVIVFRAIDRMRQDKVAYAMNPSLKYTVKEYSAIIDGLSSDARLILIKLYEGIRSELKLRKVKEIKDVDENIAVLRQLELVTEDLSLTSKGEQIAYYFTVFLQA